MREVPRARPRGLITSLMSRIRGAPIPAVGAAWGKGDSVTTSTPPDLRGRSLRGTDSGAGRDPDSASRVAINPGGNAGDMVGSVQGDSHQGHAHAINEVRSAKID